MIQTHLAGIVLAAGKGTRMKSDLPKGLHKVCGVPLAELACRAVREAGVERTIVVIGHGGERMQETLGERNEYAWQREQLGTGHAAMQAMDLLNEFEGPVLVVPGDAPLLSGAVLSALVDLHQSSGASCTLATARLADPTGYGRIVRDKAGRIERIVEHKDASAVERMLDEVSTSVYCFDCAALRRALPSLSSANAQGEYYLTDAVEAIRNEGGTIEALVSDDQDLLVGVNDRWQLAQCDKLLRQRILYKHAVNGVTLLDPDTIYIGLDVEIGQDTVIEPNTQIYGSTRIGKGCLIGPNSKIDSCELGDGCTVLMSHVIKAALGPGVKIGPFANIRPGAVLGEGVKVGNFVEIKNAELGDKVAVSHLTYIGDASIGANTNVGAGTITCNYDGFAKHRTEIGEDAFIGSNSTLVAPVRIGDGAMVAAGSVVTSDVPDDALAVGRARQEVKDNWVAQWRKRKRS